MPNPALTDCFSRPNYVSRNSHKSRQVGSRLLPSIPIQRFKEVGSTCFGQLKLKTAAMLPAIAEIVWISAWSEWVDISQEARVREHRLRSLYEFGITASNPNHNICW
jgi:hypothetical protein